MNASEYLPGGNGNGHSKPFELTKPKTPQEIAREKILETMPELRRNCSRDKRLGRCVGAKWLFGQLSDLSFMHRFGGDGFGKIYISIKDLHRIFGHDMESLRKWRNALVSTGWIWFRELWPKSEWGIAAVCKQPELFGGFEYVEQIARGEAMDAHGLRAEAKTANSNGNNGNIGLDSAADAHGVCGVAAQSVRKIRIEGAVNAHGVTGQVPSEGAANPADQCGTSAQVNGKDPLTQGGKTPHLKESPVVKEHGESSLSSSAGLPARKSRLGEREWLQDLGYIVGPKELANWGGRWRNRYRENPDKARRVLAELRSMAREKRITRNAGACADDLWKRFAS